MFKENNKTEAMELFYTFNHFSLLYYYNSNSLRYVYHENMIKLLMTLGKP